MLRDDDAGAVVITGSHAALFRGRPDGIVKPQVWAIFFNDAGVGKDRAGIARLADLETRGIAAGTVSADSAPIGNARAAYAEGGPVLRQRKRAAQGHRSRDAPAGSGTMPLPRELTASR